MDTGRRLDRRDDRRRGHRSFALGGSRVKQEAILTSATSLFRHWGRIRHRQSAEADGPNSGASTPKGKAFGTRDT
jgi:hypothetical protein